jgi:hypothetical protein
VATMSGTRLEHACAREPFADREHLEHVSHHYFHHCVGSAVQRRPWDGAFFVGAQRSMTGGACAPSC